MIKFAYNNYVQKVARRFALEIELIEAQFGFDAGNDFEILISRLLREHLPQRYGIARGSIVCFDGSLVDCDIIIYDRNVFPTLQFRRDEEILARKGQIPLEAVCAGIEVKNAINLQGDENTRNSLRFSIKQIKKIISLNKKRKRVPIEKITKNVCLPSGSIIGPNDHPDYKNPLFTMLFAKEVRMNSRPNSVLSGISAHKQIEKFGKRLKLPIPDVMVLGNDSIGLPVLPAASSSTPQYGSPFYIHAKSIPRIYYAKELAFGIGFMTLIQALDWIMLGDMPYKEIIGDAVNKSAANRKKRS